MREISTILVVGGSDSSGGAGIQADCAVARALGLMPVTTVSCITSQGLHGLYKLQPVTEELFSDQLDIAFQELHPKGVKIGMLPNEKLIELLIDKLRRYQPVNVVLDPIIAPSAGEISMCDEMWRNQLLLHEIAPYIELITPNIPEGMHMVAATEKVTSDSDMVKLASEIKSKYIFKNVLLKGGHLDAFQLTDCLINNHIPEAKLYHHPVVSTPNLHGTGCALSTAITSFLISGMNLEKACEMGINYLNESIQRNKENIFFSSPGSHGPAFY